MKLSDFVHVFTDALPHYTCEYLLKSFEFAERDAALRRVILQRDGKVTVSFSELNLMESPHVPAMIRKELIAITKRYAEEYRHRCGVREHHWPEHFGMEHFRMKRYAPAGECFSDHVDVLDYHSARRFVSFLFYLNTPDGGGETIFPTIPPSMCDAEQSRPLTITPKQGMLMMFPPLWMFPHEGRPTTFNPKYILSGYLHYL